MTSTPTPVAAGRRGATRWVDADLGCWARRDDAPPFTGGEERGVLRDWLWACNNPAADDLGLCPHHRAALLGRREPVGGGPTPTPAP